MTNITPAKLQTCSRTRPKRRSWSVWGAAIRIFGWPVAETHLGWVNARSSEEALARAKAKWPNKRLSVSLETQD